MSVILGNTYVLQQTDKGNWEPGAGEPGLD